MTEEDKVKVAAMFDIPAEDVAWFNSGCCYSRIGVLTRESAERVSSKVKAEGRRANGGMLDGMPLGGISTYQDETDQTIFDVYC